MVLLIYALEVVEIPGLSILRLPPKVYFTISNLTSFYASYFLNTFSSASISCGRGEVNVIRSPVTG